MFRISEFLLEPTKELNSFHRNVVHLYSSFEFRIQVVLTFFLHWITGPKFVETMSASHASSPPVLSPASVPVVESPEELSQSHAVTPACRSDSVPCSGQKVHCVLPCIGVCGYVCPREGLMCMGCRYVGNVGIITVRRTE